VPCICKAARMTPAAVHACCKMSLRYTFQVRKSRSRVHGALVAHSPATLPRNIIHEKFPCPETSDRPDVAAVMMDGPGLPAEGVGLRVVEEERSDAPVEKDAVVSAVGE
jgi:hypothetical protein